MLRGQKGRTRRGVQNLTTPETESHTGTDALGNGEEENGASGGVDGTEEPTLADLVTLLRYQCKQQEALQIRQKDDSERQEQRYRALQNQFQLLHVQAHIPPVPEQPSIPPERPEPPEGNTPAKVTPSNAAANQPSVSDLDKRAQPRFCC